MLRRFVRVKIRNVLSLFDGMRCGAIALERADIGYDKYFASEIDKYAIKIADKNYPKAINLGDINDFQFWEFIEGFSWESIDLVMGGSPCQDLSIAKQNREGLEGKRSGLFWVYVEILKKARPKYFLLENVASMHNRDRDMISNILGVEPIMINSALVSAQQRKRYYWTNIWTTQPNDRKIFLRDIIEAGEPMTQKSYCLSANYGKKSVRDIDKGNTMIVDEPIPCAIRTYPRTKKPGVPRVSRPEVKHDGKSNSLTSVDKDAMVMFQLPRGKNNGGIHIDKAPTMTSNARPYNNLLINKPVQIGNIGTNAQAHRVYSVVGKSVTLSANGGGRVVRQVYIK